MGKAFQDWLDKRRSQEDANGAPGSKDKLLSDEEMRSRIAYIVTERISPLSKLEALDKLFNTQKRLFAESVIGEDEPVDEKEIKKLEWESGDWEAYQRNQLRAEQRSRNNA